MWLWKHVTVKRQRDHTASALEEEIVCIITTDGAPATTVSQLNTLG